jgi:hypothetical protein
MGKKQGENYIRVRRKASGGEGGGKEGAAGE